jgi:putative molybdopterin biosynthesis protein
VSIYLHDIPLSEAQARLKMALQDAGLLTVLGVEAIPLDENALGRVTAESIWAKISSPHYHASAMDGFAVRAEDTQSAQPTSPIIIFLDDGVGDPKTGIVFKGKYVDTGDPLPDWANAVIPIENVESLDNEGSISHDLRNPVSIRIRAAVAPWNYVRPLGEDIVATQLVLPAGHILRPVDLGAIAAAGHDQIRVARKPRVAILPTGTELVPVGSKLKVGDILEYNSLVIAAQIKTMGGEPTRFPIIKDDFELICESVKEAAENFDLILLNAGSSAGSEDYSVRVVDKLGTLLIHGVAVRPGHPVILGLITRGKLHSFDVRSDPANLTKRPDVPIIGVPGYPVSAALTIEIFAEPILARWLGRQITQLPTEAAQITRKITSSAGDEDYIRVVIGKVGERMLAAPLSRGAGVITSLVQADGLVVLPPGVQGLEAGDRVIVKLFKNNSELERTIFCIGSHDLLLDLLAEFLSQHGRRLISSNVGSQGGLIALRRREAHLAGTHLLDPQTGEYNISSIRQYMPEIPAKLIELAKREQGLIVRHGNPKQVKTLQDLRRPDLQFINRQRGAGTRVLLDYHLNLSGISPGSIRGYNQEEYTHLGVAAAISSGRADCGLGIAAAAQALDLDFIPLFQERYDLVIPKEFSEGELLAPLFEILKERNFREAVATLKGYDISNSGSVILEDK